MVKALIHFFRALGRRRGFGVQSPNDYAYLRYVLCESWPYYAYRRLRRSHRGARCRDHLLGRLLLRVVNDLQPRLAYLSTGRAEALLWEYIQAGCRSTRRPDDAADAQLWVVDAVEWGSLPLKQNGDESHPLKQNGGESLLPPSLQVLVATRIHHDKSVESLWRRLQDDPRTMSSYDFFRYGVIVTGLRQRAHHYLVSQW